ncbi:MAG: DUF58 domain-containing protein [Bacteroidetes bacterium]|nr:MAG: DUF58 domain-containing protein [Bacteroidota bacterium]
MVSIALALTFIFCWLGSVSVDVPSFLFFAFLLLCVFDAVALFFLRRSVTADRRMAVRLSNSDANPIELNFINGYPFAVRLKVVEELPEQFQWRNNSFLLRLKPDERLVFTYYVTPKVRGSYDFGYCMLFASSPLQLLVRRKRTAQPVVVPVYPAFLQMRRYQLQAASAMQLEAGSKQLRKIGHSLEFEQVKEYVSGDDIRLLNWKATARRGNLMVNQYIDEKSQQVYCLIDKGRLMKMPFEGLSLLDYAINAALVLCNVSLQKQDKFGLISFSHQHGEVLPAARQAAQLERVLQTLYKLETEFLESDFEKMYLQVRTHVKQRSLLVLFTNFESLGGMKRQLPYLKQLAKHHLLMVVFFENTALKEISETPTDNLEGIYTKTIATKFVFEKRMIVKELMQHGILSLLTQPQQLTVQAVNKYLELKSRQAI